MPASNKKTLKPKQAAEYLGVTKKTLRRWEDKGYISPDRTPGNHRIYTQSDLDQAKNQKSSPTHNSKGSEPAEVPLTFTNNLKPHTHSPIRHQAILTQPKLLLASLSLLLIITGIAYRLTTKLPTTYSTSSKTQPKTSNNPKSLSLQPLKQTPFLALPFPYNLVSTTHSLISSLSQSKFSGEKTSKDYLGSSKVEESEKTFSQTKVLGATTSALENLIFKVNVPARFSDEVKVKELITDNVRINSSVIAPNIIYSLTAGDGISLTDGQTPTIANTGILSLSAGSGISVDGNEVANTGILSLEAGTNISVDGNKITNTYSVDLTESGWTTGTNTIYPTTLADKVGIGTASPSYKLHVSGTGYFSDALTLANNLSVLGAATVSGQLKANGDVVLGDATSDSLTFTGRMANGTSLLPDTDLGSDLGSSSYRFNNIYAANLSIDSGFSSSGQALVTYNPTDTTFSQSSLRINVTTPASNEQMLGIGSAGYQRALIDAEGDLTLGYNNAVSTPTTSNPLQIYGHNATNVSYIDTSGGAYFAGNVGIGTTTPGAKLHVAGDNQIRLDPPASYSTRPYMAMETVSDRSRFASYDPSGDTLLGQWYVGTGAMAFQTESGSGKTLQFGADGNSNDILIQTDGDVILGQNGNLGIGTTSPREKLEIVGSNATEFIGSKISNQDTTVSSKATILLDTNDGLTLSNDGIKLSSVLESTTHPVRGQAFTISIPYQGDSVTEAVERFRITKTGNVGIGTTGPGDNLEILPASAGDGLTIREADDGNDAIKLQGWNGQGIFQMFSGGAPRIEFRPSGLSKFAGGDLSVPNDALAVGTGDPGTAKLAIMNGNVGIGTTGPGVELEVENGSNPMTMLSNSDTGGNYLANLAGTANVGHIYDDSGTYRIWKQNASDKDTAANLTEVMVLDSNGNIGIGTTAPGAKLHITDGADSNGNYDALALYKGSNYGGTIFNQYYNSSGDWGLYIKDSVDRTRLTINESTGNVGIGTTGPGAKLDVRGDIQLDGANRTIGTPDRTDASGYDLTIKAGGYTDTSGGGTGGNLILEAGDSRKSGEGYGNVQIYAGKNIYPPYNMGEIMLYTNDVEQLRVDQSGNVGIGTASPVASFQAVGTNSTFGATRGYFVLGSGNGDYGTTIYTGTSDEGYINFADGPGGTAQAAGRITYEHDSDYMSFDTGDTERVRIDNNGNVGIGTTGPGEKLELGSGRLRLPQTSEESTPTLNFGDGDTGFYESSDDVLFLSIGGSNKLKIDSSRFVGQSGLWSLRFEQASDTNPVFNPEESDADTGIGWAGANILSLIAGGTNGLNVISNGNVGIGTTSPSRTFFVNGDAGGIGAWNNDSHSSYKENFLDVEVIPGIMDLDIKEWQYKESHLPEDTNRHLSPFAEDFRAQFGLGDSDYHIQALDVAGVALKGVQELRINNLGMATQIEDVITIDTDLIASNSADIKELENQLDSLESSLSEKIISTIKASLKDILSSITDKVELAGEWVFDKFKADEAEINEVTVQEGINLKDQETDKYYCLTIKNGEIDKVEGLCKDQTEPSPTPKPSPTSPSPTPTTSPLPTTPPSPSGDTSPTPSPEPTSSPESTTSAETSPSSSPTTSPLPTSPPSPSGDTSSTQTE